jgi:hypothetical protein
MDELTVELARKKTIRKNSGTGRSQLPVTRKYVREKIEAKGKHTKEDESMGNIVTGIAPRHVEVFIEEQKALGNEVVYLGLADDRTAKLEVRTNDPGRLALSQEEAQDIRDRMQVLAEKDLPEQAEQLAAREKISYGDAIRQLIAEDELFTSSPPVRCANPVSRTPSPTPSCARPSRDA